MRVIKLCLVAGGMVFVWVGGFEAGFIVGQQAAEKTIYDTLRRHPPKVEQLWMVAPRSLPYEYEDLQRR